MSSTSKPSGLSLARRESLWAYAFIAPWTIGFIIFTLGPMLASLFFSFTAYDIISAPKWIGITNYVNLVHDDLFWHSLGITFKYAMIALPLGLVISYLIAVLLNQKIRGINFWRTVYFLPSVIAGVAVALLWGRIFDPKFGILNPLLAFRYSWARMAFGSEVGGSGSGYHESLGRWWKCDHLSGRPPGCPNRSV